MSLQNPNIYSLDKLNLMEPRRQVPILRYCVICWRQLKLNRKVLNGGFGFLCIEFCIFFRFQGLLLVSAHWLVKNNCAGCYIQTANPISNLNATSDRFIGSIVFIVSFSPYTLLELPSLAQKVSYIW